MGKESYWIGHFRVLPKVYGLVRQLKMMTYRNSQMCIVTGPNQDIAIKLIKRLKGIFEVKLGIIFDNKETVIDLITAALRLIRVTILIVIEL